MNRYAIITEVVTDSPQDEMMQIGALLQHAANLHFKNGLHLTGFINAAHRCFEYATEGKGEKNA